MFNNTSLASNMTSSNITCNSSYDKTSLTLSVTIVLVVFIIVTILGNSLVCLSFYKQPHLRRVSYYPIISLAIADLLCGVLAMPAYIAKKHVTGGWQEGVTCDVFRFTYFFTEYASVLSLTAISVERFIAIKMPVKHRTWLTPRKMIIGLVLSWVDAALVSMLPFFWRKGKPGELCAYDPTKEWSMMVILANVFLPFLIMLCCHIYTVSYAIRYARQKSEREMKSQSLEDRKAARSSKRERDVTRTFALVVGIFVVCWGPSTFYYFILMVCPQCFKPSFKQVRQIFNAVVKLLTFANSCLNPLIYCWLNRTLRNAFYQTLLGKSEARRRRANEANTYQEGTITSMFHRPLNEEKKRSKAANRLLVAEDSSENVTLVSTQPISKV